MLFVRRIKLLFLSIISRLEKDEPNGLLVLKNHYATSKSDFCMHVARNRTITGCPEKFAEFYLLEQISGMPEKHKEKLLLFCAQAIAVTCTNLFHSPQLILNIS